MENCTFGCGFVKNQQNSPDLKTSRIQAITLFRTHSELNVHKKIGEIFKQQALQRMENYPSLQEEQEDKTAAVLIPEFRRLLNSLADKKKKDLVQPAIINFSIARDSMPLHELHTAKSRISSQSSMLLNHIYFFFITRCRTENVPIELTRKCIQFIDLFIKELQQRSSHQSIQCWAESFISEISPFLQEEPDQKSKDVLSLLTIFLRKYQLPDLSSFRNFSPFKDIIEECKEYQNALLGLKQSTSNLINNIIINILEESKMEKGNLNKNQELNSTLEQMILHQKTILNFAKRSLNESKLTTNAARFLIEFDKLLLADSMESIQKQIKSLKQLKVKTTEKKITLEEAKPLFLETCRLFINIHKEIISIKSLHQEMIKLERTATNPGFGILKNFTLDETLSTLKELKKTFNTNFDESIFQTQLKKWEPKLAFLRPIILDNPPLSPRQRSTTLKLKKPQEVDLTPAIKKIHEEISKDRNQWIALDTEMRMLFDSLNIMCTILAIDLEDSNDSFFSSALNKLRNESTPLIQRYYQKLEEILNVPSERYIPRTRSQTLSSKKNPPQDENK